MSRWMAIAACLVVTVLAISSAAAFQTTELAAPETSAVAVFHVFTDADTAAAAGTAVAMGSAFGGPFGDIAYSAGPRIVVVRSDRYAQPVFFINTPSMDRLFIFRTLTVEEGPPAAEERFVLGPSATTYYRDMIPEGAEHAWIDLDWTDPGKDMKLTVFAPDATLGPYGDASDGRIDGRIFLDIGCTGSIAPGDWYYKVQNGMENPVDYDLRTYSA